MWLRKKNVVPCAGCGCLMYNDHEKVKYNPQIIVDEIYSGKDKFQRTVIRDHYYCARCYPGTLKSPFKSNAKNAD